MIFVEVMSVSVWSNQDMWDWAQSVRGEYNQKQINSVMLSGLLIDNIAQSCPLRNNRGDNINLYKQEMETELNKLFTITK